MTALASLGALAGISAAQWGLVTTAQANEIGVSRVQLTRLAQQGLIERLCHGVYRDAHTPEGEWDSLRAAWLSTAPRHTAEKRLAAPDPGAVVSGRTAAHLHGLGDLLPEPFEFSTPRRRQSQRSELRYRHQPVGPADRTIRAGLPVTTVERTIADLIRAHEDLSLVADVLADGVRASVVDLEELAVHLAPLAARRAHARDDGDSFVQQLLEMGGVDAATQVQRLTASSVWRNAAADAFTRSAAVHVQSAFASAVSDAFLAHYPALFSGIDTTAVTDAAVKAIGMDKIMADISADFFTAVAPSLSPHIFTETAAIFSQLNTWQPEQGDDV